MYVNPHAKKDNREVFVQMINMFINKNKNKYDQIIFVEDFNTRFIHFLDKIPVNLFRNISDHTASFWLYKCFVGNIGSLWAHVDFSTRKNDGECNASANTSDFII
jgi:hypothetical protein